MKRIGFRSRNWYYLFLVALPIAVATSWALLPSKRAETVLASRHMAVTANPLASEAARDVLQAGGSAVDAAIAAQLVLTLVEPQSSGIGGGLFMLVADPKGQMRVFDGREVAPSQTTPGMFLDSAGKPKPMDDIATGGLAVGVPGAVAAMAVAHERYGRLAWRELFVQAIAIAERGFAVTPVLEEAIAELMPDGLDPSMRNTYFHPDGRHKRVGDSIRDPQYAQTLRLIADKGPSGFYEGRVAAAIVAAVRSARRNPGAMQLEDLSGYRAIERAPLCGRFRLRTVCTTPPPTGGVTLLQILGLLAGVPPGALAPDSLSRIHFVTQAERLAYADRAKWLGDPRLVSVPVQGLLNSAYLMDRAKAIDPAHDMGLAQAGTPPVRDAKLDFAPHRTPVRHGTSHLSIVDSNGFVVSMTMSVQASFGSQIKAAGFVLNNELTDFSAEAEIDGRPVANAPAPGKRPLSAMSPSIVLDQKGDFFAAIGSPGGPDIIGYNAHVLIDLIDGQANVAEVVSHPHFVNLNGSTYLEKRASLLRHVPGLLLKGHSVRFRELPSGLNVIRKVDGGYEAASDIRGEGAARGD